jgi:sugar-specific transcriptional regulator TrmB
MGVQLTLAIRQLLIKWGLNENEAAVYDALLRKGSMDRTSLAKELGVKTESLRHPLKLLLQRGLIGKVDVNEHAVYAAQSLDNLQQWFEHTLHERRAIDQNEIETVRKFSERFQFPADPILSKGEFYSGHYGLVRAYRKMLELCGDDGEILSILSADERIAAKLQEYFVTEFVPSRVRKRIRNKIIAVDSPKIRAYQERDTKELRETKILPDGKLPLNNSEMNIFGEYVLTMSFEETNGYASIIADKSTADVWKGVFEALWTQAA